MDGNLTREVARLLERTHTKDNVLLLFIDHQELFQTKLAFPELTTRALVTGRLKNYRDYLQSIQADCVSLMYGMFRPEDVAEIHSADVSVVLCGLWNPNTDLFDTMDIDILIMEILLKPGRFCIINNSTSQKGDNHGN